MENASKLTAKTNTVLRTYHAMIARARERGTMDDPIEVRFTEYVDSKHICMLADTYLKWHVRLPVPGEGPTEENCLIQQTWQLLGEALYDYSAAALALLPLSGMDVEGVVDLIDKMLEPKSIELPRREAACLHARGLSAAELAERREDLYALLSRTEDPDARNQVIRRIHTVEAQLDQVGRDEGQHPAA